MKFPHREKILKILFLIISIAISAVIIINKDKFVNLHGYGYLGIFLISVLGNATIIIPAPVILTAFVGGSIFNPFLVGVITALGATIGELTGYLAGTGGKVFIKESEKYRKLRGWIEKRGFLTIFVLAAIPNPFFDLAGIASGITGYPLAKFLLATFLGKTPKFLLFALLGAKAF